MAPTIDKGSGSAGPPIAFYCVANDRYFLGAVGLVNSLRLVGHTEPVFLLDCGLTPSQRELLAPQVTLVPAPSDSPPWLLKTIAPRAHPAEVMVLIDADMVVTRPLIDLIEQGSRGKVVAFAIDLDRFFPQWGDLLGLGQARRQSYLNSGLVAVEGSFGDWLLGLMHACQEQVDFELTFWRRNRRDYPFLYADQDVMNAILSTSVEPQRIVALEPRLSATPPFKGLKVIDEDSLHCAYEDGARPYVVHHHTAKPWLEPTHHGVYSRLLRRLLVEPDVPVRVPEHQVPLRMRTGVLAYAERKRVNTRERFRYHVREPFSERIGAPIRALAARGTGRGR